MNRSVLALFACISLASINCSSPSVVPSTPVPAVPTSFISTGTRSDPTLEDHSQRIRAEDFVEKVNAFKVVIHQEISDPPTSAVHAVDLARAEIERQTFASQMWRPGELWELVASAGANPIFLGEVTNEKASRPAFSHNIPFNGIHVSSSLAKEPVRVVSVAFVHELTHALVRNVFIEKTGLSPSEFVGVLTHCQDIGRAYFFATETLATINHITYAIDLAKTTGDESVLTRSPFDAIAKTFVQGATDNSPAFASAIAKRAARLWQKERARYGVTTIDTACGTPVIVRLGAAYGTYFHPQDLATKIISPLFAAAKWKD